MPTYSVRGQRVPLEAVLDHLGGFNGAGLAEWCYSPCLDLLDFLAWYWWGGGNSVDFLR